MADRLGLFLMTHKKRWVFITCLKVGILFIEWWKTHVKLFQVFVKSENTPKLKFNTENRPIIWKESAFWDHHFGYPCEFWGVYFLLEFHISAGFLNAFVEVVQASVLTFTTSKVLPRGGVIELSLPGADPMRDGSMGDDVSFHVGVILRLYIYIFVYLYADGVLCIAMLVCQRLQWIDITWSCFQYGNVYKASAQVTNFCSFCSQGTKNSTWFARWAPTAVASMEFYPIYNGFFKGYTGVDFTPINGVVTRKGLILQVHTLGHPRTSRHVDVWLSGAAFEFLPEHPCHLTRSENPVLCYMKRL